MSGYSKEDLQYMENHYLKKENEQLRAELEKYKPKPKIDEFEYWASPEHVSWDNPKSYAKYMKPTNLKLTFTDGVLTSAEVIKKGGVR